MVRLAPLAAALALLACNAGFDPQYRVTDLRILAVRAQVESTGDADVPLDPDAQFSLEALIVNPRAGAPAPVVSWFACLPRGSTTASPCDDDEFRRDPVGLASAPQYAQGVAPVGGNANPASIRLADVGAALGVDIVAALAAAFEKEVGFAAAVSSGCGLYAKIPIVVVAQAGERREVALKTVRVVLPASMLDALQQDIRDKIAPMYEKNVNPLLDDVVSSPQDRDTCSGGTSLGGVEALPAGTAVLCVRPELDAAQDLQCGSESLSWQWYVSAGTFPDVGGQGYALGQSIDFDPPPESFTLWGIMRDGRGGVAWTTRDVTVSP